jgi:hypothetical protein
MERERKRKHEILFHDLFVGYNLHTCEQKITLSSTSLLDILVISDKQEHKQKGGWVTNNFQY